MRPLKLTITAFGPYADEQVIDFGQLEGRNLFVITGDTGAGKTTILDAIAYGLYGRASGRERDGESLRSHFASPDLLTVVELEFELSGQRYWVRRIPKQRKKRTRGEGYTDQNAEAEFKDTDGKIGIISGVKEVNEKITDIMGLSYEQFKQIIMIPQGEFRELLNADSKARQDILQKIFGTEGFRQVQEGFDQQAKALLQEVQQLVSQRNECIRSLDSRGHESLAIVLQESQFNSGIVIGETKQALALDALQINQLQKEIDEQEHSVSQQQGRVFQGKANNLKINQRDMAEQGKGKLEALAPYVENQREKLEQGRKAFGLIGIDEYRQSRMVHLQKKQAELLDAKKQERKIQEQVAVALACYQGEVDKEEQCQELLVAKNKLGELTTKVADWDGRQAKMVELTKQLMDMQQKRDKGKEQLETSRNELTVCQQKLEKARGAEAAHTLKTVELEKIKNVCAKIEILQVEVQGLRLLGQSVLELEKQQAEHLVSYKQAQVDYSAAQNLFLTGQASLLAEKLQAGNCCPVCGSDHHPKLAAMTGNIPTEAEIKKLLSREKQTRTSYEQVQSSYEHMKSDEHARQQIVARLQQELVGIIFEPLPLLQDELAVYLSRQLADLKQRQQGVKMAMDQLAVQLQEEKMLLVAIEKKNKDIQAYASELEENQEGYTKLFAQVQSGQDAIKELEEQVPVEVRSVGILAGKIANITGEYNRMKDAFQAAQRQVNDSQLALATATAEKSGAEKAVGESTIEFATAIERFMSGIAAAGFMTESHYVSAKISEKTILALEEEINTYQAELRSAVDCYEQLQQEVVHLKLVDVSALEVMCQQLQQEKGQLITRRTEFVARHSHNQTMLEKICLLTEKIAGREEEHLLIGHLARIARGDNEQKLSFERYVLAAFFNDIIDAANSRLKKMTNGRYQMSRITQKGKGAGQSGLEIEVFDYYTGQSRHVKTLSGGESFKASLALALGLAEVVQSYAGGISLETMFVDEGFGTLDPESLDAAISCLVDLQHSGRLVGIISHVPELKNSIDARLEIEAKKDGSCARFAVG